jgi:hypothetical protein
LVVKDESTIARGPQSALTELGFNEVYLAHGCLMGQALLLLRPPELGILDVPYRPRPGISVGSGFLRKAQTNHLLDQRRSEQTAARMVNQPDRRQTSQHSGALGGTWSGLPMG